MKDLRFEYDAEKALANHFEQRHVVGIEFPLVGRIDGIKNGRRQHGRLILGQFKYATSLRIATLFSMNIGGGNDDDKQDKEKRTTDDGNNDMQLRGRRRIFRRVCKTRETMRTIEDSVRL